MPRLNQPATLSGVVHGLIKSPLAGFSLLYGLFVYALLGAVLAQMFMILVPVPYNDHHGLPIPHAEPFAWAMPGYGLRLLEAKWPGLTPTTYHGALGLDISLLTFCVVVHHVAASVPVKNQWTGTRVEHLERTTYLLLACISLEILVQLWVMVPDEPIVWQWHSADAEWWCFVIYVTAWVYIGACTLVLDHFEFMGMKQIIYWIVDKEPPVTFQTYEMQTFMAHLRHPSLLQTLGILYATPYMTTTRLLAAVIATLYLLFGPTLSVEEISGVFEHFEERYLMNYKSTNPYLWYYQVVMGERNPYAEVRGEPNPPLAVVGHAIWGQGPGDIGDGEEVEEEQL